MIATLVYIQVKPEFLTSFIEATRANHESSIKESGNVCFDILQDTADPFRFVFYEAYESEDAAVAHKQTDHYAKWRDSVAPWMAKPREGMKHTVLFPVSK